MGIDISIVMVMGMDTGMGVETDMGIGTGMDGVMVGMRILIA